MRDYQRELADERRGQRELAQARGEVPAVVALPATPAVVAPVPAVSTEIDTTSLPSA